jgi:hypothetical protein
LRPPITLAGSGSKLIRAFVGYAGWSLGDASNNETWLDLMKNLGLAYYLLAIAPDDPSLN